MPETRIGLIPDVGGSSRLPQVVGLGRAKELIMTGKLIGAEEAERIGLAQPRRAGDPERPAGRLRHDAHRPLRGAVNRGTTTIERGRACHRTAWEQHGVRRAKVMILLVLMSVVSLCMAIERSLLYRRARRQSLRFLVIAVDHLEHGRSQAAVEAAKRFPRATWRRW